jgi:hypothetical protein
MKSRQHFEGNLEATIKERVMKSNDPREEALFMIDTLLAASFFLVGVLEKKPTGERTMNCLFARAQRVREVMERAKKNPPPGAGTATGLDGDPIIIKP